MNKLKLLMLSVAIAGMSVALCGCGHNMVNYSDGIGLETTINPETYTVGLNFRYGKIFSAVVRENAKVKMSGNGTGKGALASSGILSSVTGESASSSTNKNSTDNSSASADSALEIEIGDQITGYLVDLAKVDKALAEKIIDLKLKQATAKTQTPTPATTTESSK